MRAATALGRAAAHPDERRQFGRGRAFGARHCDLVFDQPHHLDQAHDRILGVRHIARELGKEVQVFTSGAVVCRPTQREADEYFRYFAVEHRDDGAIDTMLNLYLNPANQRAMTREEAEHLRAPWRGLWRAAGGR